MVSSTIFTGVSALATINVIIPVTVQTTPNFQHLLVSKLLFLWLPGSMYSLLLKEKVQHRAHSCTLPLLPFGQYHFK